MDIKGITRKNYWDYYTINPLLTSNVPASDIDTFAHEELSADCHRLYVAGNIEVIFEYVKIDVSAFDEPWVVAAIKRWRLENTTESRAKYDRLMKAYVDTRGVLPLQTTVDIILRDHKIFKAVLNHQHQHPKMPLRTRGGRESIYALVGEIYKLGEETIEETYKLYKDKADELMGKKSPRLLSPYLLSKKHNVALQDAFKSLGVDQHIRTPKTPLLSSMEDVFKWLDDMAARLCRLAEG